MVAMTTTKAMPAGTGKNDHTGTILIAGVATVLCGLIIFCGTTEVRRALAETKIEQTYDVEIVDGVRGGKVTVDGRGSGATCRVPATEADFTKPMKCQITITDAIELAPSAFRKTSSPR
jgi:hypothetical protein